MCKLNKITRKCVEKEINKINNNSKKEIMTFSQLLIEQRKYQSDCSVAIGFQSLLHVVSGNNFLGHLNLILEPKHCQSSHDNDNDQFCNNDTDFFIKLN